MALRSSQLFFAPSPTTQEHPALDARAEQAQFDAFCRYRTQNNLLHLSFEDYLREQGNAASTNASPTQAANPASTASAATHSLDPRNYREHFKTQYQEIKNAIQQGTLEQLAPTTIERFIENVASIIEVRMLHHLPIDRRYVTEQEAVDFLQHGRLPRTVSRVENMEQLVRKELSELAETDLYLTAEAGFKIADPVFKQAAARYEQIQISRASGTALTKYVAPTASEGKARPTSARSSIWGRFADVLRRIKPGRN